MRNELTIRPQIDVAKPLELPAFWVEVLVDDKPLADFNHYSINLVRLIESQSKPGDYFLITCTCGDPGCADIWKGVKVWRDEVSIHWAIHSFRPTQVFRFEREAYAYAIERGMKSLRKWYEKYPELVNDNIHRALAIYFPDIEYSRPTKMR
jgi:hypothetical protein